MRPNLKKSSRPIPFPKRKATPCISIFLLPSHPNQTWPESKKIRRASEKCELKSDVFYLHAPDGIGRSKLAANIEKLLGVPMTGRNWNTVRKLREMAAIQ